MKKKLLSVLLAGALVASVAATSAIAVSAEETTDGDTGLVPGSYSDHPTYKKTADFVITNHLMFAMPGAWMNETWEKDPNGGSAGMYWWTGYDNCGNQGWPNAWPGYKADKVTEEGVDNLWSVDVPTYGNGEAGNATQIIWNNNIDGGTIKDDDAKNPFYQAAQQSKDAPGQFYARADVYPEYYEKLFRYVYKVNFERLNVPGASDLNLDAADFWEQANKAAAAFLNEDYDSMSTTDKQNVVDEIADDDAYAFDFSMFGSYASNFFNEDNVGTDELYPNQDYSGGFGIGFTFDNMVYVIDMDPDHITVSPLSGKPGFGGDFYFYYGNGDYGTWPTKELNTEMGGIAGNVMSDEYRHGEMPDISIPETSAPVGTASTNATSSTSSSTTGSATNTSNSAIATGQASLIAVALIILVAGVGVLVFTRKRSQK